MAAKKVTDSTAAFEQALKGSQDRSYTLRLYVIGTSPQSVRAINNVKNICEEHLQGRYDLEVIDLYQQPQLAQGEQIIASHIASMDFLARARANAVEYVASAAAYVGMATKVSRTMAAHIETQPFGVIVCRYFGGSSAGVPSG